MEDIFAFSADRNDWLAASDDVLSKTCEFDFFKGSGNGGQKRNKTSSAVRVRHLASGITATDCSGRSQHKNRHEALKKLRLAIALKFRITPAQIPESQELSINNPEYSLWAAKILDQLAECGFQTKPAAEMLGLSTSKLVKLLHRDSTLWQFVNQVREKYCLTPLKI